MKYPWNSSYAFSENRVIEYVELEGAEVWKKKWWIDYGTGILKVFKGTKDMVVDMATTYHQSPIYDKVLGTWVFKTKTANAIANDPVGAAKNAGNLALGAQLPVIIYDQLSEDGGERQGEVTGNALLFFAFKGGGKLLSGNGEVAVTKVPVTEVAPEVATVEAGTMERSIVAENTGGVNTVEKVNGRCPRNYRYAGKVYYFEEGSLLSKKYPNGVKFTEEGFPDLSPYAEQTVDIKVLNKSSSTDIGIANKMSGFVDGTPAGKVWHHVEHSTKLQLVPKDLHDAVAHTGGRATNAP